MGIYPFLYGNLSPKNIIKKIKGEKKTKEEEDFKSNS